MVETERQGIISIVGLIVSILIGVFVWQSETYSDWQGLFVFGILLLSLLIVEALIFLKEMYMLNVLWIGILSLITTAIGSFFTFDLILTGAITIVIACVIAGLTLYVRE